jgi:enoyl-CoA hydratase
MSSPNIRHRVNDTGVALVELNRPEKRNALSQRMMDELVSTLASLDLDPQVKVVCLTGSPNGPFSGE